MHQIRFLLGLIQHSPGPLGVIKGPRERERKKESEVESERERKGGEGCLFLLGSLEPAVEGGRGMGKERSYG